MPLYEYICTKCALRFDRMQSINASRNSICPECGHASERTLSLFAISAKNESDGTLPSSSGCTGCAGGACACSIN